ncbi:MAG: PspC domain-containing protein, partial [Anaerolineales bacterium]
RRKIMNPESRKLYRSRNNRMIAGVCAGLAEFFGIDATVVRLVFAAGALVGFGSFILIYLVMFVVVPEEPI